MFDLPHPPKKTLDPVITIDIGGEQCATRNRNVAMAVQTQPRQTAQRNVGPPLGERVGSATSTREASQSRPEKVLDLRSRSNVLAPLAPVRLERRRRRAGFIWTQHLPQSRIGSAGGVLSASRNSIARRASKANPGTPPAQLIGSGGVSGEYPFLVAPWRCLFSPDRAPAQWLPSIDPRPRVAHFASELRSLGN